MKYLTVLLFICILLALIAGAVIYLSHRFALFFPTIPQRTWTWGLAILLAISFSGMITFTVTTNPVGKAIFIFGSLIAGIFVFTLLSVAVVDLISLIFKFTPQTRGIASVTLTAILMLYGLWSAFAIQVKEITIPIRGLTEEIRAVHLTDMHLGNFRGKRQVERTVRKIQELNPDIVFNTGDQFDSKIHFVEGNDVLAAFRTLNIPHYFVYGNHDEHVGVGEVIARMKNVGATVLLNEVSHFGELQIIGLNNMLADAGTFDLHASDNSENIESVLNKLQIDTNQPTIILHHRPDGVKYMEEKGANLLLAGHTHAGQIFPLTFIAKLMFGYNSGHYKYKTMDIYVSEGIGTIFSPVRLGTSSELTLIRLIPDTSKSN
jgi:predicted MPP superfamily phosphohydrolase